MAVNTTPVKSNTKGGGAIDTSCLRISDLGYFLYVA